MRHLNYRAWGWLLLLGLSRPGLGQTAPAPTREDSVKGRIWTATAQRVWADEKATPPATKWATGTDFAKWVLTQKPDKSELGSLWSAVRDQVSQSQPATPTQVVQAILAEVSQRKTHKTGALAKVNLQALQVDLAPFVPAGSTTSAVVAAADSAPTAAPTSASRSVAEDEHPAPEVQTVPAAPVYTAQPLEPRYFGLPPALAGAALTLLGALLGVGLATQLRPKRHRHRHHASTTPPAEPENSPVMTSPEYRKLQKQNETLSKQLLQVQKQLAALQKQLPDAPAPVAPASAPAVAAHISTTSLQAAAAAAQAAATPPSAAVEAPASPAETAGEAPDDALFSITLAVPKGTGGIKAAPTPQSPAATRYGPVQETPFVEERKIVDTPLPQLALMLTINSQTPDQATFTLNPSVDQARLIGDGLTRLQKFFEYDPPLGGRITLVTAAATGQLQRHADGWQVVQRARLTIS